MPYPNISCALALKSHMYICKEPGTNKKTLKIQSVKNTHRISGYPCSNYFFLYGSSSDNPCIADSFVDLDKQFIINNVTIPTTLLARSQLSQSCYRSIISTLDENTVNNILISTEEFLTVNPLCSRP